MEHLFRGEIIKDEKLNEMIDFLPTVLNQDLLLGPPDQNMVIDAIVKMMNGLDFASFTDELISMGLTPWKAKDLIKTIRQGLSRQALELKIKRELAHPLKEWVTIDKATTDHSSVHPEELIQEAIVPYGVLMHIGAGNVVALSVISILEGLLSGNINLLKLPSYEGGISIRLLKQLLKIEPSLKPYIYVFDISSTDQKKITALTKVVDAVIVWGSDTAISGIRQLAPASLPVIEWGHHISFAYLSDHDNLESDLQGLAEEICLNNQVYCTSPQCVFVEVNPQASNLKTRLDKVAKKLLHYMDLETQKYPQENLSLDKIGEISWQKELVAMEEILGTQKLLATANSSVLIDYTPSLKVSPMYRNIWLMPVSRNQLFSVIRPHKGHLQTVGLSCKRSDYDDLCDLFYQAGVTRITSCANMSKTYIGEPHDGKPTLRTYTKTVTRRRS